MSDRQIKKNNSGSRHRERLLARLGEDGPDALTDKELLEVFLFWARPVCDTGGIAERLLADCGSLSAVFDAAPERLMRTEGVGERTAELIKLMPAISRRANTDRMLRAGKNFADINDIGGYFREYYEPETKEVVTLMLLDNKYSLIDFVRISDGSVGTATINARAIAETAFSKNAAMIVIGHNHPSGEATPSDADLVSTRRPKSAFDALDLRLLEHILVGGGKWVALVAYSDQMKQYGVKYVVEPATVNCNNPGAEIEIS